MKSYLNWFVGYANSATDRPLDYFPATVPGAVQLDYIKHNNLPDYKEELNFKQYIWMEEKYWVYKTSYDATGLKDKFLRLVIKGIDYKYDIYIAGKLVLSGEGMYRTNIVDLTDYINGIIDIEVVVYPAPKSTSAVNFRPNTRDEANQSCKPVVSYNWDFHPRLIPLGIWDEAYIEATNLSNITEPKVSYSLSSDYSKAIIKLSVNCDVIGWEFFAPSGEKIFSGNTSNEEFEIANPLLWWCIGYGLPNLYSWKLQIKNGQETEVFTGKIGFKTVTLEMNEGTWTEIAETFPKTRSCPPITLCLNGVNIFAKGTNWVAPEIFYGIIDREKYFEQLSLVKEAGCNIIRSHGGGIVNKDPFFELCDEMGIMVWQEFPLACNNYFSTDEYLKLLQREAQDIIDRVSKYTSLVLWCGGNELFNVWSGITEQSKAIRLLNSLTLAATPDIPFLPTSPLMGMAHGSYEFIYKDGREVFEVFSNSHNTAYTEFGVPSISNIETLNMIANEDKLFPLAENELTVAHHGFRAWGPGDSWSNLKTVKKYFSHSSGLEELIEQSQYLAGIGYRFIFEEARRQKPYCSMAINWCFNEPWPAIANNSIISYPANKKIAFYEIKKAIRPTIASAKFKKLLYKSGETLSFDIWLLNDGLHNVKDGKISTFVILGNEKIPLLDWEYKNIKVNENLEGPTVKFVLPEISGVDKFDIYLECGEFSSKYTLLYRLSENNKPKEKILNM